MSKEITDRGLRRINLFAGVLHFGQMVAVLALSSDFTLPITARYMSGPPGSTYGDLIVLYDAPLAIGVAIFLGLSSLAHFIVVSPKFFPRYIAGLAAHRNFFRWVEYSISSSVMIVLIAQVTGISEVTALISIFGVNASMILFGWLQEKYEEPGNGGWIPYVFAIGGVGENQAPTFVYFIVFTIFALFNSFALVQFLQYKKIGKWSDYLRGERTYITLSLVAKSLLAWQIFANTLIPV
jgi:hypothetical protein